jgi:hypothetical protein
MLPEAPDQVTDAWLNDALRESGALTQSRVVAHVVEPLLSQGAAGVVARFTLEYDRREDGAPRTIVGKFAAPYAPIRTLAHTFGLYGREVHFYRHFGADPGIPTPRCYFADIDETSGIFVLLLEDMGDVGVAAGMERWVEDAELAIRHLAPFHARWWNEDQLRQLEFLRYPGSQSDATFRTQARVALASALPVICQRFGDSMPQALVRIGERLLDDFDTFGALRSERLSGCVTLVHGDYHPGQLFFPSAQGGRFAVFDWQTVNAGNGGDDLARILATGLASEQRRMHEMRLIGVYHDLLLEHGVRGFDRERCYESFRIGLLTTVAINIVAGASIDPALLEEFRAEREVSPEDMMFGWLAEEAETHDLASVLAS